MKAILLLVPMIRTTLVCTTITLVALLPLHISAQEKDHSEMDHPEMDHSKMHHSEITVPDQQKIADPHANHTMPQSAESPREPIPPITPADRAAAFPDVEGHTVHDDSIHYSVLFNRLEAWDADSGNGFAWEAQGWAGTDLNRLWVRSEGERVDSTTESAELEVLYGRAAARWWDVVAGVRHDFQPGDSQTFAAIGVMGVAPYKFEVAATAYVGPSGQTAANVEVEYELLLTNRLILQPLVEIGLYGENDERRGIGSGLSSVEAGLRLRYEIRREFAPYVGVIWNKKFGTTANYARSTDEPVSETQWVAGIRAWF